MLDLSHLPPESPYDAWLNPDNTAFETVLSFIHRASRLELHGELPRRWTASPSWPTYADNRLRIFRFMTTLIVAHSCWFSGPPFRATRLFTDLTLYHVRVHASLSISFNTLERLTLMFCQFSPAKILEVLDLTRGTLRELEIRHYDGQSDSDPSFYLVTSQVAAVLPHLRRLTLAYISKPHRLTLRTVLAHLRAPQLEVLRLAGLRSKSDLIAVRQFIQTSNNAMHLKELTIKDAAKLEASCTELVGLLSEVTELQRLSVDRLAGDGDTLISALLCRRSLGELSQSLLGHDNVTRHQTTLDILPSLRRLELARMAVSSRLLETVVRSRTSASYDADGPRSVLNEVHLVALRLTDGEGDDGDGGLGWVQEIGEEAGIFISVELPE